MVSQNVKKIISKLQAHNFEAYIVGGCVRDLLLGKTPKDWDVATNALPEQIQEVFPDSFYKNKFGTVTIKTEKQELRIKNQGGSSPTLTLQLRRRLNATEALDGLKKGEGTDTVSEVEITTYRTESKYTDKRHPDEVKFAKTLAEDLGRRDFTINAMAMDYQNKKSKIKGQNDKLELKNKENQNGTGLGIVDPFNGQQDLGNKIIRAVGDPSVRFNEDALRLMRAVRFATQLDFQIEPQTLEAIKINAQWLQAIAKERIRDELIKIIMSHSPDGGVLLLREAGLLACIIPELEQGVGVAQNKHHIYTIFEHSILSLKFAADYKFSLAVRLAALFHDIAKPQAKRGQGLEATFYAHDSLGAKFASRILQRLRFPNKIAEHIVNLVRYHMFFYDVDTVTEAGVRRLLSRVGPENFKDLLSLRIADRLGSGCPKDKPYKLRHLEYLVDKVSAEPISAKMLKINGNDLMAMLNIASGPKIGLILNALLSEILDEPARNNLDYLQNRVRELDKMPDNELRSFVSRIEQEKEKVDLTMKQKHWVD